MSFLVAVYVNEGIVLARDRRSTYTRKESINGFTVQKIGIHVTNSTDKTFLCPNGAGISTCGDASLQGKPITGFIQDMIHLKIKEETSVKEIPQIIIDYFSGFAVIPNVNFLVAGYATDEDSIQNQKLYKVVLSSGRKTIEEIDTANQGAVWDGEVTTLSRITQDVALLQLHVLRPAEVDALIVVVHRHRQGHLGLLLADDILVQHGVYLSGGGDGVGDVPGELVEVVQHQGLLPHCGHAQSHAFVADIHARAGDHPLYLVRVLAAEGTPDLSLVIVCH